MRIVTLALTGALVFAPTNAAHAKPLPAPEGLAHVERVGTGPVDLVLIPGLACDWRVWEDFLQRNARRYTMYAVTLPGFGGAPAEFDPDEPTPLLDDAVGDFDEETIL